MLSRLNIEDGRATRRKESGSLAFVEPPCLDWWLLAFQLL
jgi:hypothetical protein